MGEKFQKKCKIFALAIPPCFETTFARTMFREISYYKLQQPIKEKEKGGTRETFESFA